MKKLLALILTLAMALSLAACGGNGSGSEDGGSNAGSDSGSGEATKMTLILRAGAYGDALKAGLADFEAEPQRGDRSAGAVL